MHTLSVERRPARPWWPRLRRYLLGLVLGYLLVSLVLYLFANTLLFHSPPPSYQDGPEIVKLRTSDGVQISASYLPNPTAYYTILFSHGKTDDLGTLRPFLERLRSWGFAIFAYDYHGYGTSGGSPTEENTYRDIEAAYLYLICDQHVPPERIIAFGFSLGSGPTLHLAAHHPIGGVILDSAFTSAGRVLTCVRLLPFDKFDNHTTLSKVKAPLLLSHRKDDRVVPFHHAQTLYQTAHYPKQYYWTEKGGHEAIFKDDDPSYVKALQTFTASLQERSLTVKK